MLCVTDSRNPEPLHRPFYKAPTATSCAPQTHASMSVLSLLSFCASHARRSEWGDTLPTRRRCGEVRELGDAEPLCAGAVDGRLGAGLAAAAPIRRVPDSRDALGRRSRLAASGRQHRSVRGTARPGDFPTSAGLTAALIRTDGEDARIAWPALTSREHLIAYPPFRIFRCVQLVVQNTAAPPQGVLERIRLKGDTRGSVRQPLHLPSSPGIKHS
jgi:hypothetical protein